MQTVAVAGSEKYQFFRNPHNNKRRFKTISSTHQQQIKQSIPLKLRRRNYIKQSNHNHNNVDVYKKYTEDFLIPSASIVNNQHNAQSTTIDHNNKFKREQRQSDSVDFRIIQQPSLHSVKKNSFSNNTNSKSYDNNNPRSYDHNKRSAAFTRKGLYSINSTQKDKKSSLYHYPADRYKSLTSKQVIFNTQKSHSPYIIQQVNQLQKQKQSLQLKKNSFSISRNRYLLTKQDKKQSNPYIKHTTSKKFRSHSNTQSQTIDNNLDKLIKKQFSSLSVKQLNNQPIVRNHLDHMYLTDYQKQQIKNYKEVYYIGHKAYLRKYKENQNFRDQKNNYKPIIGDHIAYRFEIVKILGSGAFGKVLEVVDHKSSDGKKKKYALKILKKSQDLYDQFKLQIKILKIVKQNHQATKNIVEIKGDFQFRNHICIVTQLLDLNVYAFIKNQQFEGLSIDITRKIMIQVLQALLFLHNKQIVHCDIKPENIVFKQQGKSGVKLVDFGSACFVDKKQFTYIQSRYYRSPQIVLVKPYDQKIDVWSTGCLAYQIFTGTPLFPARCEQQQIQMLKQTLGPPPKHFLDKCQRADQFVFSKQAPKFPISKRIDSTKVPSSFIDFMQKMVRWSPEQRLTIRQALMHEFILQGLPDKVRKEHLNQMKSPNPYGLHENY